MQVAVGRRLRPTLELDQTNALLHPLPRIAGALVLTTGGRDTPARNAERNANRRIHRACSPAVMDAAADHARCSGFH
jgi:hypothetical protein